MLSQISEFFGLDTRTVCPRIFVLSLSFSVFFLEECPEEECPEEECPERIGFGGSVPTLDEPVTNLDESVWRLVDGGRLDGLVCGVEPGDLPGGPPGAPSKYGYDQGCE
jgi:hypothetical protein